MSSKSLAPKSSVSRNVVLFAIGSSVFAFVSSALTAYNDVKFQGLHSFSLVVMLLAFLALIGSVFSKRFVKQVKIKIKSSEKTTPDGRRVLEVSPSRFWNFVHLEPSSQPGETPGSEDSQHPIRFPSIKKMSRTRRESISVVVLRNTHIDLDLVEELVQFPNLVAIDLQGCTLSADVLSELFVFDNLQYLAVFGVIDQQIERELQYSLPEVQGIFEPVLFVHTSPDRV